MEFEDTTFASLGDLLSRGDLTGAEFHTCVFRGLDLSEIFRAKRLRFFGCRFDSCNLSNLRTAGFVFRSPVFRGCKLMGVNWSDTSTLMDPIFEDCRMELASFQGLDLAKVSFKGSSLRDADFSEASLRNASLSECDLKGALFTGADLSGADLRGAEGYFIDPKFTRLAGLRCSYPGALSFLSALEIRVEG